MLGFFGKLWKGRATIVGMVTMVAGIVAGAIGKDKGEALTAAVDAVTNNLPTIITAVGGLIAVFGGGRKAGVAASADAIGTTREALNDAIKGDVTAVSK